MTTLLPPVPLGDLSQPCVWVFLCGLNQDFNGEKAQRSRAVLDALGKQYGFRFLALVPPARSSQWGNRLCWPQETPALLDETWAYIKAQTQDLTVAGYIGFSNGGFFLCALSQHKLLPVPLVAIASGGIVKGTPAANRLVLLVDPSDQPYGDKAHDMLGSAKGTPLHVTLHTFEGGHTIPPDLLAEQLTQLTSHR